MCKKEFSSQEYLKQVFCSKKCCYKGKTYPKNKGQFKKGHKPWHAEKPLPKYYKESLSRSRFKSKYRTGKYHPRWEGGKSFEEYGVEFDNALKEQIRHRDKYKCQLCGCSQIENGRQLDVHHIDYNKKNNNFENLIALCARCHIKTNHNRKYWKEFLTRMHRLLREGKDWQDMPKESVNYVRKIIKLSNSTEKGQ